MVVILQLVMLLHNFDDSFVQVIRTNLRPELTAKMWFWTIAQLICLTYVNYTLAQTQDVNLVIGPDRRMWIWEMMWIWILWLNPRCEFAKVERQDVNLIIGSGRRCEFGFYDLTLDVNLDEDVKMGQLRCEFGLYDQNSHPCPVCVRIHIFPVCRAVCRLFRPVH